MSFFGCYLTLTLPFLMQVSNYGCKRSVSPVRTRWVVSRPVKVKHPGWQPFGHSTPGNVKEFPSDQRSKRFVSCSVVLRLEIHFVSILRVYTKQTPWRRFSINLLLVIWIFLQVQLLLSCPSLKLLRKPVEESNRRFTSIDESNYWQEACK